MNKCTTFDTCRMFKHGCTFADCTKFCETEPNNIECQMRSHTVKVFVNSAFACEIFLKTLLISRGAPEKILRGEKGNNGRKGHDLSYLWGKFKEFDGRIALSIEKKKDWFNSKNENMYEEMLVDISNIFEH